MAAFSYTLVINGQASTSAVFTPVSTPLQAPVAPGTVVGNVVVQPAGWSGVLTVDAPFSMQGNAVVVGPAPLQAGSYSITGAATP
jgi:hypothetical protein